MTRCDTCEHHENRGRDLATNTADIKNLKEWMESFSVDYKADKEKDRQEHKEILTKLGEFTTDKNKLKGAWWMLAKIGGLLSAGAAIGLAAAKLMKG